MPADNGPRAAVLVALVRREEPTVLLTRRADHLPAHPGQVAFPGGRLEQTDTGPAAAALREAGEEVGLDETRVQVAGFLDLHRAGGGYQVQPVVGFVEPPLTLRLAPEEVALAFEVPLAFLMDPVNHHRHGITWEGEPRVYYAMTWHGHYIWGATAGMIRNLYERAFSP